MQIIRTRLLITLTTIATFLVYPGLAFSSLTTETFSEIPWSSYWGTHTIEDGYVKITNSSISDQNSAYKPVQLNQTIPKKVFIEGESKALNISKPSWASAYSLRANVTYTDNSVENFYSPYTTGSHDWEFNSFLIDPNKPIKTLSVIVMVYNVTGTAWFRNVVAYEQHSDGLTLDSSLAEGAYLVKDQTINSSWYPLKNSTSWQGLKLDASVKNNGNFKTHTAKLSNLNGGTRAATLKYTITINRNGLKWCEADLYTQTAVSSTARIYKNEISNWFQGQLGDHQPKPEHLWGSVLNESVGYAIVVDPNYPTPV